MNLRSHPSCVTCALALLLVFASCSKSPEATPAETPGAAPANPDPVPEVSDAAPGESESGAAVAAADPEQLPADCKYRVKGFCFASEEEACNAQGCAAGGCLIIDGKPSKVKCRD